MKILHVIQTIDTNKGGGVTARNLKIIEYLERLNDNYILTLNNNKICQNRNINLNQNFYYGLF